ncbi:hypothetical protein [Paenibacillus koleovorans]|uniref:hypothetical protein n=1 Tax=Paenibacillus koleovorans TaxID=121608 RepID=UPI000FDC3CAC|nr:hypothetical protein [Paenibacillus koleovorans]
MQAAFSLNEIDVQPHPSRDLITFGKSGTFRYVLIRLPYSYGGDLNNCDSDRYLMKKLSNAEIGSLIGTTVEYVDWLMSNLNRSEMLTYESGNFFVKKLSTLRSPSRKPSAFERYDYPSSKPYVS